VAAARRPPTTTPEVGTGRLDAREPDRERDECDDGEQRRGQRTKGNDIKKPASLAHEEHGDVICKRDGERMNREGAHRKPEIPRDAIAALKPQEVGTDAQQK